jgi:UDP-N-acetylmuramoyl-L-alanyl-D-glutamate--2,6-diaminopimelate ligase
MQLNKLLENIDYLQIAGDTNVEINGICTDSTKVVKGNLFVCFIGGEHDSHEYIRQIEGGGAVAVVCERLLDTSLPMVVVADGRAAVAHLARAFYGFADKKLNLIAVTGTNGKTTTTYMLKSIFDKSLHKTALIGTLGIIYGDKFISPELTTPDPVFLHGVFADMAECGVEYVFMEVSAHAIYYDKINGLHFKAGIFTNCTQDHLDFFKDMKEYAAVKRSLFVGDRCAIKIINSDDELGASMINEFDGALSYGLYNPADTFAVDLQERIDGTSFVINLFDELYEINLKMPALHNVYNALAAATCARVLGVPTDKIADGLSSLKGVTGRLERVAKYKGGEIFVDFAHTPDGLEKSLSSLKKLCAGRLYCLFGCGGNRDRSKRPIMGRVAAKYADFLIITSDNPRYEDAYDIINQIVQGVKDSGTNYVAVTEREAATEYAVNLLNDGDILLVAGKGGENYQEIMGIKHYYNDTDVIKKIIS